MRKITNILIALSLTTVMVSCDNFGDRQNPLYGKVFRNIKDIPELTNYSHTASSVVDAGKTEKGDYRFGISYFQDNDSSICIFEEFLDSDEKGEVNYKILDTINIGKISDTEYLTFCTCWQDTVWDSEIIALVIAQDDKEFYDNIVKAWRADTKTGKIKPVKNLQGISCFNEGYGLGDEYDEDGNNEAPGAVRTELTDSLNLKNKLEDTVEN